MKAITLLLSAALCCGGAHAQVPRQINYQGHLTHAGGTPVNASVTMALKLYDVLADGTSLYTETQTVTVTNGVFNVSIGSVAPLPLPFDVPYWLGVTVGTDAEMTPRQPVAASAYAIRSASSSELSLSATNAAGTVGVIKQGGSPLLHTFGTNNFFAGSDAGNFTMTGIRNTAIGSLALLNNTTGAGNIAIGYNAGSFMVAGNNNIAIGSLGGKLESNTIRLGNHGVHTATLLAGNVGIGTTSPGALLDVSGAVSATPITNGIIRISTTGANPATGSGGGLLFFQEGSSSQHQNYASITGRRVDQAINNLVDLDINTGSPIEGVAVATRMTITNSGNVGIGTANPTRARVEIMGFQNATLPGTNAFYGQSGTGAAFPSQAVSYSLYAEGNIAALGFVATSDARIKRIAGRSDAARDLATLANIEITDYSFVDTAAKGTGRQKKVIAQQVEKVYPQAVTRNTDVVPDIYAKARVRDGWVMLATNLKKGERVRLIGTNKEGIHDVLEVAPGRFRTSFVADADAVFVYGREVKDFRLVDYDAIAMLNVSATQELHRRLEQQAAALVAQTAVVSAQAARIDTFEKQAAVK